MRGGFAVPLKAQFLQDSRAEPWFACLDWNYSSPKALITSAPSFHLCIPRIQASPIWRYGTQGDKKLFKGKHPQSADRPSLVFVSSVDCSVLSCFKCDLKLPRSNTRTQAASTDALYSTLSALGISVPKSNARRITDGHWIDKYTMGNHVGNLPLTSSFLWVSLFRQSLLVVRQPQDCSLVGAGNKKHAYLSAFTFLWLNSQGREPMVDSHPAEWH